MKPTNETEDITAKIQDFIQRFVEPGSTLTPTERAATEYAVRTVQTSDYFAGIVRKWEEELKLSSGVLTAPFTHALSLGYCVRLAAEEQERRGKSQKWWKRR